jgi:hypothetical protein
MSQSPKQTQRGVVDMLNTGKASVLFALAATMMASPAQACWTNAEQDAAKVANLNMMMMVSALRCRKGPDDFLVDYNQFVKNNNTVIGSQNAAVRSHFARINGGGNADAAMDKFIIGIANSYGGGHDRLGCGELKVVAQHLSRKGHDAGSLLAIANQNVGDFALVGGKCSINIASK